jgi:hypothetical protein
MKSNDNIYVIIKRNKNIIIGCILIALIIVLRILIINVIKDESISSKDGLKIRLLGNNVITTKMKTDFLDPGYIVIDETDGDLTKRVQIIGEVDFNTPGKYTRYYKIQNSKGTNVEISREIIVEDNNNLVLTLSLKGNKIMELKKGSVYDEPGYAAHDDKGEDLSSEVVVSSNLNTNKIGTYTIIYTIEKNGTSKTDFRTVKVVKKEKVKEESDIKATISTNKNELTNGSVRITLDISRTGYDHTILPNQFKSYNQTINYNVSSNGTYVFNIYDKNGNVKTVEKIITNIDNQKPVATCIGEIKDDSKTYLEVDASDNSNELKYVYKSGMFETHHLTSNNYILNFKTEEATVTVYDKVGNTTTVLCNIS